VVQEAAPVLGVRVVIVRFSVATKPDDRSRRDMLTVALQELIEAELTATIGARPVKAPWDGSRNATGTARSCCRHVRENRHVVSRPS
jgi:hypothetical protein